MLLWRARVFDRYNGIGPTQEAPPGEQAVIQLRSPYPITAERHNACPGKPLLNWSSAIYVVTPDLKEPDPNVDAGAASALRTSTMMLNQGIPYFIDRFTSFNAFNINNSESHGLTMYCRFNFVTEKK